MNGRPRHLLVATDGSDTSERALTFAVALARRYQAEVLLCYVVDHARAIAECSNSAGGDLLLPLVQALDDAAKSILADAARRATAAGLRVSTTILDGRPAQAIVKCATGRQVDAIVLGTQGKRGLERFFLGSTTEGVLRRTDVPAFVVPPGAPAANADFERILVAVDDSDPSEAAASFALDVARAGQAHLIFCSVAETTDLRAKAATYGYDPQPLAEEFRATAATCLAAQTQRARASNVECESVVAEGEPAQEILNAAASGHADLIVVGTHGRRGLRRLFFGSVAEGIVRRSDVPVVVVRTAHAFGAGTTSAPVVTLVR